MHFSMKVLGIIFINFLTNIPQRQEYYAILVALFFLQAPVTVSKENGSKHSSRSRILHILTSNVLSSSYRIFSDCISEYNPLILAWFCQSMLRGLSVILTKDFPLESVSSYMLNLILNSQTFWKVINIYKLLCQKVQRRIQIKNYYLSVYFCFIVWQ